MDPCTVWLDAYLVEARRVPTDTFRLYTYLQEYMRCMSH